MIKCTWISRIFLLITLLELQNTNALKVLFIGNSYTYVNDVPAMVKELATSAGEILDYDQHTEGGWTLNKHANSETTLNKIRQGGWDVVILQGHSQETSNKNETICNESYPYAKILSEEIHKNNPQAKIQWYLTWGRPFGDHDRCEKIPQVCTYEGMQDAITKTYTTYACMFKPGQVSPVGEAFREFQNLYGKTEFYTLYNTNGLLDHHASLKGSYLSACVHFGTFFPGKKCTGNSYYGGLDMAVATKLQLAADNTVSRENWSYPMSSTCNFTMCTTTV